MTAGSVLNWIRQDCMEVMPDSFLTNACVCMPVGVDTILLITPARSGLRISMSTI